MIPELREKYIYHPKKFLEFSREFLMKIA